MLAIQLAANWVKPYKTRFLLKLLQKAMSVSRLV